MEAIVINKAQLQAALQQWEQDHRDGKTRTHEATLALPVEQVAQESADYLWGQLQPMQPTYYVRHPDDSYSVTDPQPRGGSV